MAEHPAKAWDSAGRLITREEAWGGCEEAGKHVVRGDGTVNWRAAFAADPGVTKCPACHRYLWWEGASLQCVCGEVFRPGGGR